MERIQFRHLRPQVMDNDPAYRAALRWLTGLRPEIRCISVSTRRTTRALIREQLALAAGRWRQTWLSRLSASRSMEFLTAMRPMAARARTLAGLFQALPVVQMSVGIRVLILRF